MFLSVFVLRAILGPHFGRSRSRSTDPNGGISKRKVHCTMRSSHILFVVERGRLSELLFLSRLQGGIFVLVGLVIVLFCSVSALSSSPFYFNPPFALTGASSFRSITSSIPTSSRSRHLHDDEGCLTLWAWGGQYFCCLIFSSSTRDMCSSLHFEKGTGYGWLSVLAISGGGCFPQV